MKSLHAACHHLGLYVDLRRVLGNLQGRPSARVKDHLLDCCAALDLDFQAAQLMQTQQQLVLQWHLMKSRNPAEKDTCIRFKSFFRI